MISRNGQIFSMARQKDAFAVVRKPALSDNVRRCLDQLLSQPRSVPPMGMTKVGSETGRVLRVL
jgi:hypothetical protein